MFTRVKLRETAEQAERRLRQSFEQLSRIRTGQVDDAFAEILISFQSSLARAMYDLECAYSDVQAEKRRIVARKPCLLANYVARRLKTLATYRGAIESLIDCARILGDSFAWLFYSQDRPMMTRHYRAGRQIKMPTGVGGWGELEFVTKLTKFNKYFVLYHSITTFLRIGDVSFFDLETRRVAAIGELKSQKISENEIRVTVHVAGESITPDLVPPTAIVANSGQSQRPSQPKHDDRLKRQLKQITRLFKDLPNAAKGQAKQLRTVGIMSKLAELHDKARMGKVAYVRADEGLLLVGAKTRSRGLAAELLRHSKPYVPEFEGLNVAARALVAEGSVHNRLSISAIPFSPPERYSLPHGMCPLCWWPVPMEIIRKLFFRGLIVLSLYNHAFLLAKLQSDGLKIGTLTTGLTCVETNLKQGPLKLLGIEYYGGLIQRYLIPESSIVELIKASIAQVTARDIQLPAVVQVDFAVDFA